MSKGDKDTNDTTTIDGILRGLSSRSNVHATLILSRKDGSIIRATGFREPPNSSNAASQPYKDKGDGLTKTESAGDNTATEIESEKPTESSPPTPAEILASSIYAFIQAADTLASYMVQADSVAESYGTAGPSESKQRDAQGKHSDTISSNTEHEVQLLRMRTRRQEIIIFPDPNYLACVVQNVGRNAGADNAR